MRIVQATFGVFHQFELARELDQRGHLTRIYSTFPWRRLAREGVAHAKVESFPWLHTPQMLLSRKNLISPRIRPSLAYYTAVTFDAWLKRRIPECDAIVALSGAALATGLKVQQRGGKFICDRGSTHRLFQRDLLRDEHKRWGVTFLDNEGKDEAREVEIYERADAITVPSTAAKLSFLTYGHAPERVHVIPYGVRLERFRKDGEPPSGPDATFEVLFVGHVSLQKGVPYLLQAFARLRHPRKRLRLVGSIDPALKFLLGTLPQQHVEFLGAKPQAELIPLMSRSHVMVLASIQEGLALVQGQAMACGCPVIATTATGAEDLFSDGVEGFIVPVRSPEALLDRMQRFADDPRLRECMGAAALRRVQSLGGWNAYGTRWESLLRLLTNKE